MPPGYAPRFRLTVRKIGTFHRREASMPPGGVFGRFKTDLQTLLFRFAALSRYARFTFWEACPE